MVCFIIACIFAVFACFSVMYSAVKKIDAEMRQIRNFFFVDLNRDENRQNELIEHFEFEGPEYILVGKQQKN